MRSMAELFTSPAASKRRVRASEFVDGLPGGTEVLIVSASRGAADDVARDLARREAATFGLHRFSLAQLAARLAATRLAAAGTGARDLACRPGDRRARRVRRTRRPARWNTSPRLPGCPASPRPSRAACTICVWLTPQAPAQSRRAGEGGRDLAALYDAAVAQFETGGAADRAQLFTVAREVLESGASFCEGRAVVLVDVAIDTAVERAFVAALLGRASAMARLRAVRGRVGADGARGARCALRMSIAMSRDGELDRLRRHLFKPGAPPVVDTRLRRGVLLRARRRPRGRGGRAIPARRSAPGRPLRRDGRAAALAAGVSGPPRARVRACRHLRVASAAARGVRIPPAAHCSHCCRAPTRTSRRTGLPSTCRWRRCPPLQLEDVGPGFSPVDTVSTRERVTVRRRSCPQRSPEARRPKPEADRRAAVSRSTIRLPCARSTTLSPPERTAWKSATSSPWSPTRPLRRSASPDEGVVQGMVRAPYRWEEWLVESAVIAGRDRWRRLDGVAAEYRLRLKEARREDAQSPRVRGIERDLSHLEHLRAFALPLIDEFDAWPETATWGEWLDRLEALVPRVIRQPLVVQRVLAELRPMAAVGPVSLREVREVLSDRLRTVAVEPPAEPLWPRVRRHRRRGPRTRLPHRLRAGPRRARVPAEAARGSAAGRCRPPPGIRPV